MASTYFDNADPSRPIGLKVEERIFWVSNQGLAMYSPVFNTMFFGDFTEAKNQTVSLPNKKADDILEMLLCLFPTGREMKEVDAENVDVLLTLADEYEIEFLEEKCVKFLTEKLNKIKGKHADLWFVLRLASKYHLHDLVEECAKKCTEYTLKEALDFIVDLPPTAVALVALHAWKEMAPERRDACTANHAIPDHAYLHNYSFSGLSSNNPHVFALSTSVPATRLNMELDVQKWKTLVENMKKQDA